MTRQILSTPVALLCAAFLTLSLVACSDDDASVYTKEVALLDAKKYGSLEELPACSEDLRGQVADVAGVYYACVPDSWMMIEEVVGGVCNIRACDAVLEGSNVFSITGRQVYTCRAGSWVDSHGKSFSDEEYIECFIGAMIQDTVASVDSLTSCNAGKEGALSVVMGGNLMACASKKWVGVSDTVVTENELPTCSKSGKYVYVLSKVKAYECKDGVWYNGSIAVSSSSKTPGSSSSKVSSSSKGKDSSSSKKPESSASVSSSSKTESSSSKPIDDGTPVRGICKASVTTAQKGDAVTYSFYNLGGTPQTFNWIFGDVANPSQSDEVSPEVAFNHGGWHKAKLVVNEGMESESDTIVCTGVTVHGTPVTGCECSTDAKYIVTSAPDEYSKAEWTVTGCSGAGPFTYDWSSGGVGEDSVGVGTTSRTGDYAPYVVVTNSDGEYMTPTCKNVFAFRGMSFSCELTGKTIKVFYESSANSSYIPSVDLSIVAGSHFSTDITMNATDKYDYYNADGSFMYSRYTWYSGITSASYTLDDTLSPYLTYAVLFAGDTMCTLSRATCGPTDTSNVVFKGEEASWTLFVDGKPSSASSYEWKITDQDDVTESNLQSPAYTYSNVGTVSATLTVDKDKTTETSFVCSDLKVIPDVTGCVCAGPLLRTGNNNLAAYSYVSHRWWVTDCDDTDSELYFDWKIDYASYLSLDDDYSMADVFSSGVGSYAPTVDVSNEYGVTKTFTCSEAHAVNIKCAPSSYSGVVGETMAWSVSILGDYEVSTYSWEFTDDDETLIDSSTQASPEILLPKYSYMYGKLTLNKGLDDEMNLYCGSVFAKARPLNGCTCGEPELISNTNNVHNETVVKYRWHVTGCDAGGALPLKYSWFGDNEPDQNDSSYSTLQFTELNAVYPGVWVENVDGNGKTIYCPSAPIMDAYCYPSQDSVAVGDSITWIFQISAVYDYKLNSYDWTVTDAENNVLTYDYIPVRNAFQAEGMVNASVTFNAGTEDEFSLVCSPLKVKPAPSTPTPITGCGCKAEPISEPPSGQMRVEWTIYDCESEGATPLTYSWGEGFTPDPADSSKAIVTYTESGEYRPIVTVENTEGVTYEPVCPAIHVEFSGN